MLEKSKCNAAQQQLLLLVNFDTRRSQVCWAQQERMFSAYIGGIKY